MEGDTCCETLAQNTHHIHGFVLPGERPPGKIATHTIERHRCVTDFVSGPIRRAHPTRAYLKQFWAGRVVGGGRGTNLLFGPSARTCPSIIVVKWGRPRRVPDLRGLDILPGSRSPGPSHNTFFVFDSTSGPAWGGVDNTTGRIVFQFACF